MTFSAMAPRLCAAMSTPATKPRGAASLIVVMILFFLMSLAAAYTSRNLIFEQRTSANQYRSSQALEAAEAGVEWAIAMLNSGRITASCLPAAAASTETSFRQRYLAIGNNGMLTPRTRSDLAASNLLPSCVFNGTDWNCNCPVDAAPTLAPPTGSGVFPAFRVRFNLRESGDNYTALAVTRPGVVIIESNGCTRLDDACLNFPAGSVALEGRASVTVVVALKSALPVPPSAALTVLNDVVGGASMKLYNTDAATGGVTIRAGGPVSGADSRFLFSSPGTPGPSSVIGADLSLAELLLPAMPPPRPNRVFASLFGADAPVYQQQPAAIPFTCGAGDCLPALAAAVALNPDRVFWINGDLNLLSVGTVGSLPDPVNPLVAGPTVIVATGGFRAVPGAQVFGLVYTQGGTWTDSGQIRGAAFIESALGAGVTSASTIIYDRAVLDSLKLRSGSFVRVPGGWKDFE